MMDFDLAEFLIPLTPLLVVASLILGGLAGWVSPTDTSARRRRLFWMVAYGLLFYLPGAALRAWEGSPVAERFAATSVLWAIFAIGAYIGSWRPKKPQEPR